MSQLCLQMKLLNNVFQSMFQGYYKAFIRCSALKDSALNKLEKHGLTNLNVFLSDTQNLYMNTHYERR